ncbi:MAG: hypothetical protein ABW133_20150 [Polyangiaceae bacterium]
MTSVTSSAPELRSAAPSRKALYLALLVPIFGLAELGAHFFFARRAPTTEEWAAVRPLVMTEKKGAAPIVVAPYWAEPMARLAFGDELMPLRDVARPDTTRYPEALEVSIMGSRAPELEGWKTTSEARQGKFTLRTKQNPVPVALTYDFVDHVDGAAASVKVNKSAGSIDCSWNPNAIAESGGLGGAPVFPAQRFVCGGEATYVFVGVTIIDDEQSHPRRCIWSHPPGADAELVTRFRDVPLGTQIHGHAGAGWLIERDHAVQTFTVRVMAGGEEVGKVVHAPGDAWKSFEIALPAQVSRRNADVEFRVSAPGGGTHVCFEADSR